MNNQNRPSPRRPRLLAAAVLAAVLGAVPGVQARTVLLGVGDSLTHGTMDATNNATNTLNAYLQKVAESLAAVRPLLFTQPLFDDAGDRISPFQVPTNLGVDGADTFSAEGLEYYLRVGAAESYLTTDYLCDPKLPALLDDSYDRVLYPLNLLTGASASQMDGAEWWLGRVAGAPSLDGIMVLWLGNNDASTAALGSGGLNPSFVPLPFDAVKSRLSPAVRLLLTVSENQGLTSFAPYTAAAIERNLTTVDDFTAQYNQLLDRLESTPGQLSPALDLFLVTLPYYSGVGYLMDADDIEFFLRQLDPAYSVPPGFTRPDPESTSAANGDRVSLFTFGMMYTLLATGASAAEVNAILADDGLVLSEAEQEIIIARIDAFNQVITDAAAARGPRVHLADLGGTLNDVLSGAAEVVIGGRTFDRRWGRGNALSMDGVHPGHTIHAYLANAVLGAINTALGENAPLHDLETVALTDPYVDKDGDGWVPGPSSVAPGFGELLVMFADPDDANAAVRPVLPPDVWERISDALLDSALGIDAVRAEAVRLRIVPE